MMITEETTEDLDAKQLAMYGEDRHVFVMTANAKPVFTFHGDEDKWSPLMATVVALCENLKILKKDTLR